MEPPGSIWEPPGSIFDPPGSIFEPPGPDSGSILHKPDQKAQKRQIQKIRGISPVSHRKFIKFHRLDSVLVSATISPSILAVTPSAQSFQSCRPLVLHDFSHAF